MRIMLLCSAFNGLSQRAWADLREAGHDVTVELAVSEAAVREAVAASAPDLIVCPFLRERVPAAVWENHRTIIIHPGPRGDRGPSSLDWAITEAAPEWGVTALQAVEELDAGPVWGTRTVEMIGVPRKSSLYNGPVADAAIELIREVVVKAGDPAFVPEPQTQGFPRSMMRQSDREFSWSDSTADILRRIRAADGSPGVRTTLCGIALSVFDAHQGSAPAGEPGTIALRHHGAVLVRTGDGALWVGHVEKPGSVKLPATLALGDRLAGVPTLLESVESPCAGHHEVCYSRTGDVGVVDVDCYNGAMSTEQCGALIAALRHAAVQDTKVIMLRGGEVFSNGIHLNVIETAPSPAAEAWRNIDAINDVCREIITCTGQLVVSAVGGSAGAGGVMLALGADHVLISERTVLNPHYGTMGLHGSEYWTYVLPRRVGAAVAASLTRECLPVGSAEAVRIGLADQVLPSAGFREAALEYAAALADDARYEYVVDLKRAVRAAHESQKPLETYQIEELAEMSRDIFLDRNGFAAARHAFVTKQKAGRVVIQAQPSPLDRTAG